MNSESLCAPRNLPEKKRERERKKNEREREREREKDRHRDQSSGEVGSAALFSKGTFIL